MPLKGPWLLSHKYSLDCKALKANPLTVNSQDLWLAKDNRFLNPKISYERILMAPPCRLIVGEGVIKTVPTWAGMGVTGCTVWAYWAQG